MRRTYRSKKETAGAIDPRDVLFTIDAKSSVFDAFYIQNIKQTKRDMSVGSTMQFAASNKVRKRKYVKRIKEQETSYRTRESTSSSAFLTPDKSIRVNKAPDLFDQLLNSSNNTPEKLIYNKPTLQRRTYNKKQISKKNINYSNSECTDSDKENTNSSSLEVNKTANSSDIKSHKLLIEKEIKNSPEYNDKSINEVVNNISIFSHLRNSIQTPRTKENHLMPYNKITQKSPLCSTPFHEKYRGASIYRFSPISINLDDSPKEKTAIKNNEKQIHFSHKEEKVDNIDDTVAVDKENPQSSSPRDNIIENFDYKTNTLNESQYKSICPNDNQSPILSNPTITKRKQVKTMKNSLSFQTTEIESFHGFSNSGVHCKDLDAIRDKYKEMENILTKDNSHNETSETLHEDEISDENASTNNSDASFISGSESNYDTCNSEDNSDEYKQLSQPIVVVERLNDSIFNKYYELMPRSESLNSDCSTDLSDSYNNSNNTDSLSVSDNCYEIDLINNVPEVTSINSSDCFNTYNNDKMDEETCVSFVTTRRRILPNDSIILDIDNSIADSSGSDADKTVLRKSVADNSDLRIKCDHTENTLDNNKEIDQDGRDSFKSELHIEDVDQLKILPEPTRMVTRKSARMNLNTDSTSINCARNITRNSSIDGNIKNISKTETNILNLSKEKPSIVLQPGKRWERSLSIYRRMTTIENFDKTILDEEQLLNKGRKYRQSVITTMELQEKGSLHNDSIKSRRSTFVSKPSRSTIKIVRESDLSRDSLCSTIVCEDLQGFLGEDCDDTIVELSKLSIADSEHEVTLIEKFHDTSNRIASARDYVLRRCNQADVLLFDECYPDPLLKNCRKIGEGVYGEVFLWRAGDGRARVLKVIPIAGDIKVNGEEQKGFHEILSEIVIAMELSALRAPIADIANHLNEGKSLETLDLHTVENATDVFNEVLSVRCVTGGYPSRLLDLWDLYDESKGSENDNPAVLPTDQQFIVLELANAGQDLESYQFVNAEQSYALFKQIAFGLAVAEEAFQFEHRDLHWGNVLIAPTDQKSSCFVVRGRAFTLPSCGVKASIIDYSLSRASVGRGALYADLAQDEALFEALGDYQFTVYRLMRDKLGNDWKNFEPYTNILWLHYTLDKMITALRYTRTNTKIHKQYIAKLKEVKNRILDYGSAVQLVLTDNEI